MRRRPEPAPPDSRAPHRQLRSVFATAAAALYAFVIVTASGCGPDAVGVDECRQIEQARCEAGADCGLVKDLDACKRFYRDHCLHGMTLEGAPRKTSVDRCVGAIRSVGTCGKTNTATADCSPISGVTTLSAPCDAVDRPEDIPACSFLVEKEQPAADASGADAAGGASNDGATDSASD
jgi:hypothetical protein